MSLAPPARAAHTPGTPRLTGSFWRRGLLWLSNPYAVLDHALASVGLTFRARLPVLGEVLVTGDPELLRLLMAGRDFEAGKPVSALRALLGSRSLIMLHGDRHAARQLQVAPLFRGSAAVQCERWTVEQMALEIDRLPRHKPFSAYDVVQRVALRAILASLFGVDVAEAREAEHLVQRFLHSFRSPLVLFIKPMRIDAGPLSPWGRAMRNRRHLCAFIGRQIDAHRRKHRSTMLGQLLASQPAASAMADEEIMEEILALLLFGHDTGAATMAWALAHLYSDAAALQAAENEARQWRKRGSFDPHELPWLSACVNESMRLCPVVAHLSRRAIRDTQLGDAPVARGETVLPCSYLAQHNPVVFPSPYAFRPERFLEGQRYDGSFFPFGFGNRTCVGKPFVSRQMPLMIAALLASANLRLAPGYRPCPTRRMVLIAPSGGTRLAFRETASNSPRTGPS